MRTTLDIDDDVLIAGRARARQEGRTAGKVLSDLTRAALVGERAGARQSELPGFRPLPHRGPPVTDDVVDKLRGADHE